MIDVLAFPPSDAVLDRMRAARLARAQRLEARGRVARFVSVGLFLGWVADVGAALAPAPGTSAIVFGVASLLLALLVIGAHLLARGVLAHADRDRRMAHRDFSPVRMDDVEPLLARAAADTVVAQYLRMVGRQRRPLVGLELAALMRWRSAPSAPRRRVTPRSRPRSAPWSTDVYGHRRSATRSSTVIRAVDFS